MILGMSYSEIVVFVFQFRAIRFVPRSARDGKPSTLRVAAWTQSVQTCVPTRSVGTRLDASVFQNRENDIFLHEQQLFVADLECLAGPGAEEHAVADLDLKLP